MSVKLSNLQITKLKSRIKNGTKVTLNLLSNVIGDSNNDTNFPHKLLLTDTQVSRLGKGFANDASDNITFSKTWLSKMVQLKRFLGRLLGPLIKVRLPFMQNVFTPLARSVLVTLGLTAAASATDAALQKKVFGLGITKLIISNKEIEDIKKKVKSLEESGLLWKGVSKIIKNKA